MSFSVRPIEQGDIMLIADYWLNASDDHLRGMGADPGLLPDRASWSAMLLEQLSLPVQEKKAYCLIWLDDGLPIGHCNINKIIFGREAFLHLHLWHAVNRQGGSGSALLKQSLPFFFENFHLQVLYCEPFARNPAPNKTLARAGFTWVKEYVTVPGSINFEQPVNLWEMTAEDFAAQR